MARLLVMDDDPQVAATIAVIAEDIGFEVETVVEPALFFTLVDDWEPTHIALDLNMPQMDGVEVIRALGQKQCRARLLITSGMGRQVLESASNAARERGLSINGLLPKPFTPADLRALLDHIPGDFHRTGRFRAVRDFEITEAVIDEALTADQFRMVFQPQVRVDGSVRGFEALLRWTHPEVGEIPPSYFVPIAEQSDVIHRVTARAFAMSLDWFSGLNGVAAGAAGVGANGDGTAGEAAEPLLLSVNLSVHDVEDLELVDQLRARCDEAGVAPERVILELTETGTMRDAANAMDVLTRLRLKGFRLSIDDFGTGYSSLSLLARLPVSEIKVDRSFVGTACDSAESRTIVEAIISLAANLGLETVAEGVENEPTAELLRTLGCDVMQGYHIARPLDPAAATAWLTARAARGSDRAK